MLHGHQGYINITFEAPPLQKTTTLSPGLQETKLLPFISCITMDSKGEHQLAFDHEVAPPSYTETTSPSASNLFPYTASSASQYYGAQIRGQLRSLTTQIRSAQTHISSFKHGNDERILALLATEIQNFFSGFANSGLQRGTLILVPAGAVQEGATPMEYDFRDPEEYDQVVRVRSKEEMGSGDWYWRDEEMAERLARYVSPAPVWKELPSRRDGGSADEELTAASDAQAPRKAFARRTERTPTEEMQKQSRGFFGFRQKGTISSIERPPTLEERDAKADQDAKLASASLDDKVILNVKAEEVSFRTENEMGIFETQRGWAVVLKMKVELGSQ